MKKFNAILLSSLLLVGALSGAQMAFASHFVGYPNAPIPPKNTVVGGIMPSEVRVAGGIAAPLAGVAVVHTFDAMPLSYTGLASATSLCFDQALDLTTLTGLGAGDLQHVLVDLGTPNVGFAGINGPHVLTFEPVGVSMASTGAGSGVDQALTITLGPFAPIIGTVGPGPFTFYLPHAGPAGSFTPVVGPVGWEQTFGPSVGSTTTNIAHAVVSMDNQLGACGCDDNNNDGICSIGDADGVSEEKYFVDKPVAGEIIPINTTALLIAGIAGSPLMILSTLGVAAAGVFGMLRFVVKRN